MTSSIGILGAGRVGTNLARELSAAGHHVTLGVRSTEHLGGGSAEDAGGRGAGVPGGRSPEEAGGRSAEDAGGRSAEDAVVRAAGAARAAGLSPRIAFTDQRAAARTADIVINATPGAGSLDRLSDLRAELAGKILVDVSNATRDGDDGLPGDLCYPGGSLAEKLQAALPDTRVVKTLNTMLFTVMTAPESLATPPTVYLSGDDENAKRIVSGLLGDLGWQPGWIEDLGGIGTARATEAMILVVPHVLRRGGFRPFAVSLAR